MEEKEEEVKQEAKEVSVQLTALDWHVLLGELEHNMRFVNRDCVQAYRLWELIASQLNGRKTNLILNGVDVLDENHMPWKPIKPEEPKPEPKLSLEDEAVLTRKWWQFWK